MLFASGDEWVRYETLAAHDATVAAIVRWIEVHAHTRFRIHGDVAVIVTQGIVVATFRQQISRALDPHLRPHVVAADRVRSPGGQCLAHDARNLKLDSGPCPPTITPRCGRSWWVASACDGSRNRGDPCSSSSPLARPKLLYCWTRSCRRRSVPLLTSPAGQMQGWTR